MAIMIPSDGPREHTTASREAALYESLSKLPDDFYVVHSMSVLSTSRGMLEQREADFVVFHRELGLLCIEAKAGQVGYSDGAWRYGSGAVMSRGGPYSQANGAKHHIMRCFEDLGLGDLGKNCKFLHAVWFITLSRKSFAGVALPPEASRDITLFAEDVDDPEPRIREIMAMEASGYTTNLSEADAQRIVREVLCPEFSIVPTKRMRYDIADGVFARLLDSQIRVLNFIRDQRSAVINGAAGTGKTLIAMEHARRASASGKVIFLCFNAQLKEHIAKELEGEKNIDVWTIAGYACSVCKSAIPNYDELALRLMDMQERKAFPYQHVVVDEGQDFGIAAIDRSDVLTIMKDAAEGQDGSFFLFYDKRQFVQGSKMPSFIYDADCKLTLYVNCRNTEGIARCCMRSLGESGKTEVLEAAKTSGPPHLFASEDREEQAGFVEQEIARLRECGLDDIVILSCKTVERSALRSHLTGDVGREMWKGTKIRFTTARKFKGLEADAVILVDVDESLWTKPKHDYDSEPGLLFYTGASRAKHELRIVCDMGEPECVRVLEHFGVRGRKKPVSKLAKQLNAMNVGM